MYQSKLAILNIFNENIRNFVFNKECLSNDSFVLTHTNINNSIKFSKLDKFVVLA